MLFWFTLAVIWAPSVCIGICLAYWWIGDLVTWLKPKLQLDRILSNKPEKLPDRLIVELTSDSPYIKIETTQWLIGAIGSKTEWLAPQTAVTVPRFLAQLWLDCGFAVSWETSHAAKLLKESLKLYHINSSHILCRDMSIGDTHIQTTKHRYVVTRHEDSLAILVPVSDLGNSKQSYIPFNTRALSWFFDHKEVSYSNAKCIDVITGEMADYPRKDT